MLLLESDEHAAEVFPYELLEKGVDGVGGIDVVLLQHFIRELRACLERQTLRLAESVVAVKENIFHLTSE